jgi:hypothetical protein
MSHINSLLKFQQTPAYLPLSQQKWKVSGHNNPYWENLLTSLIHKSHLLKMLLSPVYLLAIKTVSVNVAIYAPAPMNTSYNSPLLLAFTNLNQFLLKSLARDIWAPPYCSTEIIRYSQCTDSGTNGQHGPEFATAKLGRLHKMHNQMALNQFTSAV